MEKLNSIFIDFFDDPTIKLSRSTAADDIEDWDSLAQLGLVLSIEREFQLRLNAGEVGRLENVGSMVDLIHTKHEQQF